MLFIWQKYDKSYNFATYIRTNEKEIRRFMNERVSFGSKLGAILAAAGSAVGLGNIWRFPYEPGNHGGAAFILIYLVCVFALGLPVMMSEFIVGRHSKASTGGAFKALHPKGPWKCAHYFGLPCLCSLPTSL